MKLNRTILRRLIKEELKNIRTLKEGLDPNYRAKLMGTGQVTPMSAISDPYDLSHEDYDWMDDAGLSRYPCDEHCQLNAALQDLSHEVSNPNSWDSSYLMNRINTARRIIKGFMDGSIEFSASGDLSVNEPEALFIFLDKMEERILNR
jgi:hypothetical protein